MHITRRNSVWLVLLLLAFAFGCGTSQPKEEQDVPSAKVMVIEDSPPDVVQPMTSRAPTPTGPTEVAPPDEGDTIRKVLSVIESSYNRRRSQRPIQRVAYAKGSGCAAGSLNVSKTIPLNLRWGIFSDPGKSYPLWARFSSGNGGSSLSDTTRDSRGLAIKLLGIVGQKLLEDSEKSTQDFLFQNSPSFFAKDVAAMLRIFSVVQRRPPYEAGATFRGNQEPIENPLHAKYWTAVPFRLGDTAVKFQVVPTECKSGKVFPGDNEQATRWANANSLREEMKKTLGKGRACFLLEAQSWKDEVTTPIENASVVWATAFQRVAWIVLEKADAKTFARNSAECEKMSFSPWHGIAEHQPLGGINRLRKETYSLSARIRHKMNYWSEKEPTGP